MAPEPLRAEVNAIVLANFGNPTFSTTTSNYTIYGMPMHVMTLAMHIEVAFDDVQELMGANALTQSDNYNKIKLYMAAVATLRTLNTLQGLAITKHFNYSSGGLNIQKPVVSQMAAMVEQYRSDVSRYRKMLLTRAIVNTGTYTVPNDLLISIPNESDEDTGIKVVSYDSGSL